MANNKRHRKDEPQADLDNMHPSRQKRVKYSDKDAQLAKIYNDLADEVQAVRIKAAGDLLKSLSKSSPDQSQRLDAAETRLIRGLCSGRKAARLGFSIALAELFRLKFRLDSSSDDHNLNLVPAMERIKELTKTEGNVRGQKKRDHLLGRRFAFQALLQSDVALQKDLADVQWSALILSIFQLADEKPWLRRECGIFLYEYLVSPKGSKLDPSRVQAIVHLAAESKQLKTPEGVGLWIAIQDRFPGVRLPKGVWHHNNPLSSKERPVLSKVLMENAVDDDSSTTMSGTRQSSPSFVWSVVLSHLYRQDDDKQFSKFWERCVVSPMFSSSPSKERKSLGLQTLSLALSTAPISKLPEILHPNILQCIVDERGGPTRYLFDAAKIPLTQMVSRAKEEPEVSAVLVQELITKSAVQFDQLTKTNTVESIIRTADDSSLHSMAEHIKDMIQDSETQQGDHYEKQRRMLADMLLVMVRFHKDAREHLTPGIQNQEQIKKAWLGAVLNTLASLAYGSSLSTASKTLFRSRLMSCLNCLMDSPFEQALRAPLYVVRHAIKEVPVPEVEMAGKQTKRTIQAGQKYLKESSDRSTSEPNSRAFSLLFAMSILQVYNREPDAISVLGDLVACYRGKNDTADSSNMIIELLLSFVSKPSALFRKFAEQVFSAFAAELTAESLQSLTDILQQEESLSGQKQLFDDESGSGAEDGEEMDLEDASDVELVNGHVAYDSESDDQEDNVAGDGSSSAAEESSVSGGDEEAAFDKKLADALGTAGMDDDSDEDGSDMDDEQMMALEPHLTSIFKERQNKPGKKQEQKDAKETIVNFKNRVLDLLTIYVKNQYASVLALDVVLPLTTLVRTTASKPTAEKAFAVLKQYFDACNKNKSLPQPASEEACFEVLAAVHEEMTLGGSKLHANACSRSSLFLSKVLITLDQKNYQRIATMYAKLQSEWYADPNSKIQGSVFTEWTSWSIVTRKHI